MADKHATKMWLHVPERHMPPGMYSGRGNFLFPILREWLHNNKLQAEDAYTSNAIQLYMNSYDPRLTFTPSNYSGALWLGYSPDEINYLKAHDSSAQAWFVPMQQALPSLMYFMGQNGIPYAPRVSTMLTNAQASQLFFDSYKQGVKLQTDGSTIGIGLWLDYDGCPNYRSRVLNFIRLLQRVFKELGIGPMFSFWVYTAGTAAGFNKDELSVILKDNVTMTDNPLVMLNMTSYYMSLDTNATSFDPLAVILSRNKAGTSVVSPPRMDMLGSDFHVLPGQLSNCLDALMSPGSPGVDALLEPAGKAVMQLFNLNTKEGHV